MMCALHRLALEEKSQRWKYMTTDQIIEQIGEVQSACDEGNGCRQTGWQIQRAERRLRRWRQS